jgi:hypothetical protein
VFNHLNSVDVIKLDGLRLRGYRKSPEGSGQYRFLVGPDGNTDCSATVDSFGEPARPPVYQRELDVYEAIRPFKIWPELRHPVHTVDSVTGKRCIGYITVEVKGKTQRW